MYARRGSDRYFVIDMNTVTESMVIVTDMSMATGTVASSTQQNAGPAMRVPLLNQVIESCPIGGRSNVNQQQ